MSDERLYKIRSIAAYLEKTHTLGTLYIITEGIVEKNTKWLNNHFKKHFSTVPVATEVSIELF